MKTSSSKAIQPVKPANATLAASPFAPARQHAERAYLSLAAGAQEALLCGVELIRLCDGLGETRGGDHGNQHTGGKSQKSHGETFSDLIEREVGISRATAFRWMQAARAQLPAIGGLLGYLPGGTTAINDSEEAAIIDVIAEAQPERLAEVVAQLSNGKTLEQLLLPLDAAGQFDAAKLTGKARDAWEKIGALCEPYDDDHLGPKFFEREEYDAMHEDALVMRRRVEAGELPPTRAWAGLRGRAAAEAKGGRNATDHYKNIATAFTKLGNSVKTWAEMPNEARSEIEGAWSELWKLLPATWKATAKQLEGWK